MKLSGLTMVLGIGVVIGWWPRGSAPTSSWASKQPAAATVGASTGLVTAVGKGTAVIVGTWSVDPTVSVGSTITVTP